MNNSNLLTGGICLSLGLTLGVLISRSAKKAKQTTPDASKLKSPPSSPRKTFPSIKSAKILLLVNGNLETASLVATYNAKLSKTHSNVPFGKLYRTTKLDIFSIGDMYVGEEAVVTALCALLSSTSNTNINYNLVILIGSCGALPSQARSIGIGIGDVIASYPTTCFFERRIAAFGEVSKRQGIGETATWEYTKNVAKLTQSDLKESSFTTQVAAVKMASGRSFATDATGIQWMQEMNVTGKDMEAAAAMATCQQFGVPATCLKVVVDLVHDVDADVDVNEDSTNATGTTVTTGTTGNLKQSKHNDVIATYDRHLSECIPILIRTATTFVYRAQEQLERTAKQSLLFTQATLVETSAKVIAIHIAMQEEARPIAKCLGLTSCVLAPFAKHGFMCWTGTFTSETSRKSMPIVMISHGTDHILGLSRVSTQIASLCINVICQTYGSRLACLINCGTAGAMNDKNLQIGSIVVAKSINFIDARGLENRLSKTNTNATDGTTGGTTGGTTDGTTDGTTGGTTDGTLKVWNTINTLITNQISERNSIDVRSGIVGTGSSFDLSPSDLYSLKKLKVDVKEMEAAAVVWTCNRFNIPVVVVKSVTDFVEHIGGHEEFSTNLWGKALVTLSQTMPSVVSIVVENV